MSAKFDKLAAETGSTKLAGWITQHNATVHARALATLAKHAKKKGGKKKSAADVMKQAKAKK
jgi:hypothetical protein